LLDTRVDHPRRTVIELVKASSLMESSTEGNSTGKEGRRYERRVRLPAEEFTRVRAGLPRGAGEVSTIREGFESLHVAVVLEESPTQIMVTSYAVPKRTYDDWWQEVEKALDESSVAVAMEERRPSLSVTSLDRRGQSGIEREAANTPTVADDLWDNGALDDLPLGRSQHTAVWTGSMMIVWGGEAYPYPTSTTISGGRYDPATDTWMPTSTARAPTGRKLHTAVWTGSEMIVWGGSGATNTGGR
jgi:hypothetical protein